MQLGSCAPVRDIDVRLTERPSVVGGEESSVRGDGGHMHAACRLPVPGCKLEDATSVAQQLAPELCWALLAAECSLKVMCKQAGGHGGHSHVGASGTCGACPSSCHGNSKDGGGTRQACAQREPSLLTSLAHHLQCIAFLARSLIRCQYAPAPRRVLRSPAACGVRLPVGELAWPLAVTGWAESAVLGSQAAVQQGTRVMLLLLLLALLQTLAAFQCTCQAGAVVGRHSCCLTSHHLLLQRLAPPHAFILVRTRHRRCWLVALALASWARPTTWFRRISGL